MEEEDKTATVHLNNMYCRRWGGEKEKKRWGVVREREREAYEVMGWKWGGINAIWIGERRIIECGVEKINWNKWGEE